MSIVEMNKHFTSGINKIEDNKPLSEWAVEFIHEQNLSRESYSSHVGFRSLLRRQKDAIRYQLQKELRAKATRSPKLAPARQSITQKKTRNLTLNWITTGKLSLGIWISVFLLFDVAKIYIAKGASPFMAWQAALLVEVCIILASLSRRKQLRRIAYALFVYNVLLFAFMEIDQVISKSAYAEEARTISEDKRILLRKMKDKLTEQLDESTRNLKRLDSDHKRGYITSGSLAYEKISKSIATSSEKISSQISTLETELYSSEATEHSTVWIYVTSVLYFLLRSLLQLFSIILLKKPES